MYNSTYNLMQAALALSKKLTIVVVLFSFCSFFSTLVTIMDKEITK